MGVVADQFRQQEVGASSVFQLVLNDLVDLHHQQKYAFLFAVDNPYLSIGEQVDELFQISILAL